MENSGEFRVKESLIEKEKKGPPKIGYHFFYSAHITAKDVEAFGKPLKEADIVFKECVGWDEQTKREYNALSQGKITPSYLMDKYCLDERASAYKELEIIYNSKKPILFADVGLNDDVFYDKESEARLLLKFGRSFFEAGTFKQALKDYKSGLKLFAKAHSIREKRMEKNLKIEVAQFLEQNPDYAKKEKLRVLVELGGAHSGIYINMKKKGIGASREYGELPFYFDYFNEVVRRFEFKKRVSDEMVARAIIAEILYDDYLGKLSDTTDKAERVSRKICSSLSIGNIEKISQGLRENKNFIEEVEKFGVKVPKSGEEINKMVERQ